MKRRLNEVGGVKVIRRYGAGSIFSGLICLGLAALPLLLLFTQWISGIGPMDESGVRGISVLTIFQNNFDIEAIFDGISEPFYYGLLMWVIFFLWCCSAVFALVFLFLGLEFLFRGKIGHFKLPSILGVYNLIFAVLGMGCALAITIIYKTKVGGGEDVQIYLAYIYAGLAIIFDILLAIIYQTAFKNKVFIGDLGDLRYAGEENINPEKTQIKYETKEVVRVRYEPAIGLPAKLSSIGGHAFSQNMNLKVAMIPMGIKTLGQAAFSNCGHLEVVSIPTSVRSIGYNCFFNCVSLKRINYAGTKEQWRHVRRGSNWLTKAGTYTIVCVDGPIIVNPYH